MIIKESEDGQVLLCRDNENENNYRVLIYGVYANTEPLNLKEAERLFKDRCAYFRTREKIPETPDENILELFLDTLQKYRNEGYVSKEACDNIARNVMDAQKHLDEYGTLYDYKSETYNEQWKKIKGETRDKK